MEKTLLQIIDDNLEEIKLSRVPTDLDTKEFLKVVKSEFQRRLTTPALEKTTTNQHVVEYLKSIKESNLEIIKVNPVAKLELENQIADKLIALYKPNLPTEADIKVAYDSCTEKGIKAMKETSEKLKTQGFEVDMKLLKDTITKF